ncbi:STAS domain-containing protein [Nonomuraea sp. NPDC047529]|uniref:STAS domain-containing protein n=1 Tax=Nonomuraea sp. NPDC047529 TaxID=3155623 RepID=UPI003401B956
MDGIDGEELETSWQGPRLRAETRQADGCLVMELSGDLDFTQKPEFRKWALGIVAGDGDGDGDRDGDRDGDGGGRAPIRMIVLDLEGVEFFDSTGLAVVIALWKHAHETGGDLAVARPPSNCANMMRRTGMAEHIAMGDTVLAATAGAAVFRRASGRERGLPAAGWVTAG